MIELGLLPGNITCHDMSYRLSTKQYSCHSLIKE
uniref:Uncharacterized protein n=1 Tax=Arundo donax TaxID=35708 RepID=A0A0A9GDS6_ARUDO